MFLSAHIFIARPGANPHSPCCCRHTASRMSGRPLNARTVSRRRVAPRAWRIGGTHMRAILAAALAGMIGTIIMLAPVGHSSAADFAQFVSQYRTCWTIAKSIAGSEDSRPSSDRWDFLLRHRDAIETMGDLGCRGFGYIRPTDRDFVNHSLRPKCAGRLKIAMDTEWHEAFDRPVGWPIYMGCIWYHRH